MKKNKVIIFLPIFILFASIALIVYAATFYQIIPSATVKIDEHGVCKNVKNNNGSSIFVPTATPAEWQAFRDKAQGVALSECIPMYDHISGFGQSWSSIYPQRSTPAALEACQRANGRIYGSSTCKIACIRNDYSAATQITFGSIADWESWKVGKILDSNPYNRPAYNCKVTSGNPLVSCAWSQWDAEYSVAGTYGGSGKAVWCMPWQTSNWY